METTFDIGNEVPESQKAAEAEALAQGEKIADMEAADKAAKYENVEANNESAELIAGKFKTQEDLLKAYEELQSKLGSKDEESTEEPTEEVETTEEETTEEVEVSEIEAALTKASELYATDGKLNEESIEELSKMDSKDLIEAYVTMYSKNQAAATQTAVDTSEVMNIAGGKDNYTEMVQWAGNNLSESEIAAYNNVTNSGNMDAIRFAVEALSTRYKNSEGSEKPLITGKSAAPKSKAYRSNAELARDIANPRYHSDPAFRMDVEAKLANSSNLL